MRRRVLQLAVVLAGAPLAWPRLAAPAASPAGAVAPPASSRGAGGFPLLERVVPSLEEVDSQSFGITTDPTGILYIASVSGVLTYDGAWWRLIPIGSAATAFEVATGPTGQVAVGGQDELGYLAPDRRGRLRFKSLLELLPPSERRIGQVLKVLPTADGFAFLTADRLLVWEHGVLLKLATFPGDRPYPSGFALGEEVYVWARAGLLHLVAGRLEAVAGGDRLRKRVDLMLPAADGVLLAVRDQGLALLRHGRLQPFAPQASRWAADKHVLAGCLLPDGRWALGSVLGGLVLLRPDGVVDQAIDSSRGLWDDYVTGMVVDREGSLWLTLNSGLARVEVASPLTLVDGRLGLKGSVYSVARHAGRLWVGTSAGVFTDAPEESGTGATLGTAPPLRFHSVSGVPPSGWGLLSMGESLLAATAFGLYEVTSRARFVVAASEQTAYVLVRSQADPRRVWAGTFGGLAALRKDDAGWRLEGRLDGLGSVRTIVEGSGGMVWCGTDSDGAFGVEASPSRWATSRPRILPVIGSQGQTNLYSIGGAILATVGGEILRLDEATRALRPMPELAGLGRGRADQLATDAAGNLWINWVPPLVALRRGATWGPEFLRLPEVRARTASVIFAEPGGVVWLGTDAGLYRYAGTPTRASAGLPPPLLAELAVDDGAPLFGGAPRIHPAAAELPAATRRLRIDFAPLSYRAGLSFQTRLEPIDAGWGPARPQASADLLRLPPGKYTFHVRTVGPNREPGPQTAWSFRVLPPWYATSWALAIWAGCLLAGIRSYGSLRSHTLSQRAARLEARVADQTVELQGTLQELREAHARLETANARLEELSLSDELTGIANRRRFQQALEVEWTRARRTAAPLAVILLDLDHFKMLNDLRGHAEGDLALQGVAHHLAATVRRAGDVLARWGGEEFAVLLPNTDAAGAQQVADQLRRGIEELRFPHPNRDGGVLTASFGVAAAIPAAEQPAAELVEAADAALYRAKSEGRNRVRVAPPSAGPVGGAL